jgi:hypothetical protein
VKSRQPGVSDTSWECFNTPRNTSAGRRLYLGFACGTAGSYIRYMWNGGSKI